MERKRGLKHFRDLEVYKRAFQAAMRIFKITKIFPAEEKYSLTDQMRRSSRSVCANLAEAWRKRSRRREEDVKIGRLEDKIIKWPERNLT